MASTGGSLLFYLLAATALFGAAVVVWTREIMRLALGLGILLLATAGLFAYAGFGLLAVAEIFLYVGGVLILFLFAIMLVRRETPGEPRVGTRASVMSVLAAAAVFGTLVFGLNGLATTQRDVTGWSTVKGVGESLLGTLLPQFELAGVLLLVALVAIVVVAVGDDE